MSGRLLPVLRAALLFGLLAAWEWAARSGALDVRTFSAPTAAGRLVLEQLRSGSVVPHFLATLQAAGWGLVLGFLAGAALGWLAGTVRWFGRLVEPVMLVLNAIPRVVLAPVFILWLGIGIASKVALSFFLVVVLVFFAVYGGLREVNPALVDRVQSLGGSRWDLLREVQVPSVLAWVFSSLRVTVGFAFTGAVVGEFIASSRGLGYLLNLAQNTYNATLLMATVAQILATVLVLFAALEWVERRATRWKQG